MRAERGVCVFVRDGDAIFYDSSSLFATNQVTLEKSDDGLGTSYYLFDTDASLRSKCREAGESICCRL